MSTAFVTAAPLRVGAPSIGRVARRTRTVQLPVVPKRCAPAFILRNRSARGRGSRAYIYASTPPPEEPSAKEPPPDAEVVVVTEEGAADDAAGKKRVWTWRGPDGLAARVVSALKSAFAPGGFAWGLVAGAALAAGVLFIPDSGVDAVLREKVAIFDFILQDINASYVDRVDIDKLFETGVNSMLGTLDPYTQFENNSEALEMSLRTSGRYAGVGLGISAPELALPGTTLPEEGDGKTPAKAEADKTRDITVVSAFEGYAFDAGVRPGDVILEVGGQNVDGLTLEKVTDLLRGEAGTSVDIRVRREGHASPLKFTLQRSSVHIRDVPVSTLLGVPADGIGYIRLQSFAKDAAAEVRTAFSELVKTAESAAPGKGLRGLVLDLRGNPGGLLNAAIEVSETLVPRDSVIVSTRGRGMGAGPAYRSSREPDLPARTRLAVLVDGQTASASEIVAGAVQDLDVGIVVGSRTFGKGLVQNVQELPYRTALKYTVGKYYTPSGRCIQKLDYRQGGRLARGAPPDAAGFESTEVADSNRRTFRTAGGRAVRDGGGIEPDVGITKSSSFLELALQRQGMFFRFASRFAADRGLENLPEPFGVTDGMFRDFVSFVSDTDFRYNSTFDDAYDEIDAMLEKVGYAGARGRVADLRRATESEMREDFVRHEADLKVLLESAIRTRFQPDSSRIKAELRNDDTLKEAVRVLRAPAEYAAYLEPAQALADAETGGTPSGVSRS